MEREDDECNQLDRERAADDRVQIDGDQGKE